MHLHRRVGGQGEDEVERRQKCHFFRGSCDVEKRPLRASTSDEGDRDVGPHPGPEPLFEPDQLVDLIR